ncbi:hypothetical protein WAG28_19650 [Bacillus cereus]|uniref:Uncharacterized protein n=1 Tax=Bacillus cereus TaxID=1396 RepID=A0A164HMB1_BACCE|nr:hypothetical protein B4082_0794 [Bacillus cereus]MDF2019804.1 hypothetical protein [Bacillus sp. Cr_R3]
MSKWFICYKKLLSVDKFAKSVDKAAKSIHKQAPMVEGVTRFGEYGELEQKARFCI